MRIPHFIPSEKPNSHFLGSTPMYQILQHALSDPSNKTRFTLIFANLTPADILLKSEFDALRAAHPDTFSVVYTVDNPGDKWDGPTGYVNKTLLQQHIPPASLADKVKILVCGPPGQVNALAGKKDGMKQGQVGGLLKELGYTEEQVSYSELFVVRPLIWADRFGCVGVQVLDVDASLVAVYAAKSIINIQRCQ